MTLDGPMAVIIGFVRDGGFVMGPLVAATFVLWYALGYRYLTLRRGSRRRLSVLVSDLRSNPNLPVKGMIGHAARLGLRVAAEEQKQTESALDDAFGRFDDDLKRGRMLIKSIVVVAPLAGLLGTVTGMIETFDSLADMALFSQSGGIAGGISQALFTTQMGLAVAIPGVIMGRSLDRRQGRLEEELVQLKMLLTTTGIARAEGGAT